eukprot:15090463-Alexandrium_andersonii.AAC.1
MQEERGKTVQLVKSEGVRARAPFRAQRVERWKELNGGHDPKAEACWRAASTCQGTACASAWCFAKETRTNTMSTWRH